MFDKKNYSTIILNDEDGNEREVLVLCRTSVSGNDYILVTDDDMEKEEVEVTVLKENKEGTTEEDIQYDVVDDENEAAAMLDVFRQLMEIQENTDEVPEGGKWT
jgi:hypothetical protein